MGDSIHLIHLIESLPFLYSINFQSLPTTCLLLPSASSAAPAFSTAPTSPLWKSGPSPRNTAMLIFTSAMASSFANVTTRTPLRSTPRRISSTSAMICMVDNYANGIVEKPLTMAEFKEGVKKNEKVVESVLDWMLEHFVVPHRQ